MQSLLESVPRMDNYRRDEMGREEEGRGVHRVGHREK